MPEEKKHLVGENGKAFKIYSPHRLDVADTLVTERQRAYYIIAKGLDDNTYICKVMSDTKESVPFERSVSHHLILQEKCAFTGQNTRAAYHFNITLLA